MFLSQILDFCQGLWADTRDRLLCSYGSRAGLFAYAYIVAINGRKPETVEGIYKTLSSSEEAKFMLRYWSNDQYLHNFYEVVFEPDEVELMNAM